MIDTNEIKLTQELYPLFLVDSSEWDNAMLRLKSIHRNNTNPFAAALAVRTYRARLGFSLPDARLHNDTVRSYGYGLLLDSHGYP